MLNQYEEIKKIFQLNCRVYEMEKKEMQQMRMQYPGIEGYASSAEKILDDMSTFDAAKRYWYLKQAVDWVESVFRIILNEYGDFVYKMFVSRFIKLRTQEDVAKEMGMTRRQLQYEEDKVIRSLTEKINEGQKLKHISQ